MHVCYRGLIGLPALSGINSRNRYDIRVLIYIISAHADGGLGLRMLTPSSTIFQHECLQSHSKNVLTRKFFDPNFLGLGKITALTLNSSPYI
jgi:hypothetical protein